MMKNDDRCELIKKIVLTVLVAIISVTLVFPLLLKLNFITEFFMIDKLEPFIGIGAIMLVIVVYFWKEFWLFWKRYIETKRTGNFPLISIDFVFIYIFLVAVLVCVFRNIEGIEISNEFGNFLWVLLIISLFFFLIGLTLSVKGLLIKRKSSQKDNEDRILPDEPITSMGQDKLQRKKFVVDLSKIILTLPSELTGSFTIGLNGSWGEGKTSVINLLIEKLKESTGFNDNFLLIQFDPWCFGDEKAILNAFYDQLEKAFLEQFIFAGFKKSIARYLMLISTGVSFLGFKFDIHSPIITFAKTKKQIENYIQKAGKKVLIIIDDIDRLQPDEMALVFKLVRNNTNFENAIFLLSFDTAIVEKALKEKCNIDRDFLEKIINKPIPLPEIEQQSIDDYILKEIKQLLKAIDIPEDERAKLVNKFSNIYRITIKMQKLFRTIRVAKRYINSLYSSLPSVKSEVYLIDFLLLESLKLFHMGLYRDIWANPWYYIKSKDIEQESLNPLNSVDEKLKYEELKAHVEKLLEHTPDAEIFKRLLLELFPEFLHKVWSDIILMEMNTPPFMTYRGDRLEKRIFHPDCFPKYFLLQVPSLEISDEKFEAMIFIWKSMKPKERKESIKQELFNKDIEGKALTSRWIQKLWDFNGLIASPSLAQSIIEVIYENADKFTRGHNNFDWSNSEFSNAVQFTVFLIKDKVDKQSIAEVLEDALMKTPDLVFSSLIIEIWKRKSSQGGPIFITDSIDLKPLEDKVIQRLQEYFIDKKVDIFEKYVLEWSFILYRWGTHFGDWDGQFSQIIQDYVLALVKDDPKKFYKFIYKMADKFPSSYISESELEKFAKHYNVTKFKEIALKFKDDKSLLDEERKLISQFLDSAPQDQPQLSQE